MNRFCEWCARAKVVAIELFLLVNLIVGLGFAIYFEWRHLAGLARLVR